MWTDLSPRALLESSLQDARYALRTLGRSKGFAAAVVVSLGLGIGANTAIFSLIDAVLLRTLPVREPERLLLLARTQGGPPAFGFDYQDYRALRDAGGSFAELAAYARVRLNVRIDGGVEPTAEGLLVSGSYFSVLGVGAAAGRAIGQDDDRIPDAHPVAMLSHGYWTRRFGKDAGAIGSTIALSGRPFTVVGVAPPGFFGVEVGTAPEIFVPLMMQPTVMPATEDRLDNPINVASWLKVLGRLRPQVSPRQAAGALDAVHRQIDRPAPKSPQEAKERAAEHVTLVPAATGLSDLRRQFSSSLFILMGVVALVLAIACANVANLWLARAAARRGELALRLALGAGRGRLLRQLLVESLLLAAAGGACGLVFAGWAGPLLLAFMAAGRTPLALDLGPDLRVLGFTALASLLTGVLFGLAPARLAGRVDLAPALGRLSQRTGGRGPRPARALVVAQVALSVVLLFGALLFVRSLQGLESQDAGFRRDSVLVVRVEPRGSDQRGVTGASQRLDRSYRQLLDRARAIPGVRSASLAAATPTTAIQYATPLTPAGGEEARVRRLMTYPGYFETLGIELLAGRDLAEADLQETSALVAVVNRTFAERFFAGENPVGRRFLERDRRPREIVGVVADSRYASLRDETPPLVYQPFLQTGTGRGQMVLHVRSAGPAGPVLPRVREAVQAVDAELPLFEVHSLAAEVDGTLVRERLLATLSGFFGGLALLLACVGLYGLLAYSVVQRTGELGVRIALGAGRRDVLWLVMRESLGLVLLGIAIGVPAALALGSLARRLVAELLFGVQATDPSTLAAAALAMLAAAALASALPARRAALIDPLLALRND